MKFLSVLHTNHQTLISYFCHSFGWKLFATLQNNFHLNLRTICTWSSPFFLSTCCVFSLAAMLLQLFFSLCPFWLDFHHFPLLVIQISFSKIPTLVKCIFGFHSSKRHFMTTTLHLSPTTAYFIFIFKGPVIFYSCLLFSRLPSFPGVYKSLDEGSSRPLHLLPQSLDLRFQTLVLLRQLLHLPLVLLLPFFATLLGGRVARAL